MRHVLRSQQFDRPFLENIFTEADRFQTAFSAQRGRSDLAHKLHGRMLFNIFYEPSTRTRMSFSAAAEHLGMRVVTTENAREFSSAAKGETLEDTIRVLCGYHPDVITLRHHEIGSAERAAAVSTVPIINAGDGTGQHPTQALLDLYTIMRECGRIDGLTVIIGGDLANGRTARSLAYLLAKFTWVSLIFVSPPELRIGSDIKEYLMRHHMAFSEEDDLHRALPRADVVYWTRIQKERMDPATYAKAAGRYLIGKRELSEMQNRAILLHPLPRIDEIAPEVDSDPRAAYFRQAANGMFIRMALLAGILKPES